MEQPLVSCVEILEQLTPVLPAVLNAYRVPEPRAREIVDDACRTLLAKRRLRYQDPEGWLLRTIIESCRKEAEEDPELRLESGSGTA
ncbi:MAG: hypothetical protein DMF53_20420 [Acidobacteria bacterium]|nr:MAG: hypothetical protein DMF53_20420 [Acidobacteriota bacterium]